MLRTCALLLPCLLGACTWFSGDRSVLVHTEPPGARILVDGQDTGKTTPSRLDLGGMLGSDHVVTFCKRGFRDEARLLSHHTEGYTSRWIDGAAQMILPALPNFWTPGDFLSPFAVRWAYVPHELYVRLYREDQPMPTWAPPPGEAATR